MAVRQDLWDDYAGNQRHASSQDYMCFKNKLRVYFPVTDNTSKRWYERIRDELNAAFGGSTSFKAEGSWLDEDTGRVVIEPVRVIEVAHNCHSRDQVARVARVVKDAAQATRQTALSIETNQFHIIPVNYMMAPGDVAMPGDGW